MALQAKVALSVFAVLFLTARPSAGLCLPPTVERESPYHYIVSLSDALAWAKSGLDRTDPANLGSASADYDLLLGLRLAKVDFQCAESQVSPYATSSNKAIKVSAGGAADVFARVIGLHDRSISQYAAFLDSAAAGPVKPGTALQQLSELGAAYDEQWKRLITAVIAGTYSVVDVEPSTGLMSRLALTAAERDAVLKKLVSTFGPAVMKGLQPGQALLTSAASALYQVVGDPKRKVRESK